MKFAYPEAARRQLDAALRRAAELGGTEEAVEFAFRADVNAGVRDVLAWDAFRALAVKSIEEGE